MINRGQNSEEHVDRHDQHQSCGGNQQQRLDSLDELLVACGWQHDETGWLAPGHLRKTIGEVFGLGHLKRCWAIAAQVQFDEACVASYSPKRS